MWPWKPNGLFQTLFITMSVTISTSPSLGVIDASLRESGSPIFFIHFLVSSMNALALASSLPLSSTPKTKIADFAMLCFLASNVSSRKFGATMESVCAWSSPYLAVMRWPILWMPQHWSLPRVKIKFNANDVAQINLSCNWYSSSFESAPFTSLSLMSTSSFMTLIQKLSIIGTLCSVMNWSKQWAKPSKTPFLICLIGNVIVYLGSRSENTGNAMSVSAASFSSVSRFDITKELFHSLPVAGRVKTTPNL